MLRFFRRFRFDACRADARGHNVERMQFVLDLRRHGIMDAAVLRAMEEVPRGKLRDARPGQVGLRGPCHADTLRPDHQPALRGRLHDRTAQGRATPSCARDRHRLRLPGRGAVAARRQGHERRALPYPWQTRRGPGLRSLACDNVEVIVGDGIEGAPERAPFDRIMVTAATEEIPQALVEQLAADGVMVLPLGPQHLHQSLVRLTRTKTVSNAPN